MDAGPNPKKNLLGSLLIKLHYDEMTGVVTIKDDRKSIKIYLKAGHVRYRLRRPETHHHLISCV